MLLSISLLAALASLASVADAECANACNGHGKCTSYDMCLCNRNWQGNDCSERVCQFGSAHVDSPKGDLDMSGGLSGPDAPVVDNNFVYPYGTTEQFPQMEDSDLKTLVNSAHYYMECSNKGTCNRATGDCMCYEGYDGVSCQRASCPGYPSSCSGHGVCKTIQQLANADAGNVYKLWDKDATMGCECDAGYWGPDCSLRACKTGVDPLYLDDAATVRYSTWDFAVVTNDESPTHTLEMSTDYFSNGNTFPGTGHWAIRFYDTFGEDWLTGPIEAGASCADVVAALEALPNNVVPASSIDCTNAALWEANSIATQVDGDSTNKHPETYDLPMAFAEFGYNIGNGELGPNTVTATGQQISSDKTQTTKVTGNIYRMKFYGNPGKLKQPEIEVHLDGKRPSIVAKATDKRLITKVWTDGQAGEDVDNFADHCDGVTVTIVAAGTQLTGMTAAEMNLLKACLGDSDFDTSNNVDVYNWDYGSQLYPHIIKLVKTVTSSKDGGYYAAIWYTGTDFKLVNPFFPDDTDAAGTALTDSFDIYTTKGTLALTSNYSEATFNFGSKTIFMTNSSYDVADQTAAGVELGDQATSMAPFDGDISCEIGNNNAYKTKYIFHCLNKTDMFTMLNWEQPARNPPKINLYTAERLFTGKYAHDKEDRFAAALADNAVFTGTDELHYMTHSITTDISTNWAKYVEDIQTDDLANSAGWTAKFHVYKFFPAAASQYEYAAECSNRGICDSSSGTCKCFSGYTSDSCGTQISVSC